MDVAISFGGERLEPLACGGLWWPAGATLFVADLHLEKASHFARAGWMLPPHDSADTLGRLIDTVEAKAARRVVALGDSFHDRDGPGRLSDAARTALRLLTGNLDWWWITGNHDDDAAGRMGGRVLAEAVLGPFILRHEAVPTCAGPELSGHFHPKLVVRQRGRHLARRCFAASAARIILPAYGALAGGLDVADAAIATALAGPGQALLRDGDRLLRFPIVAAKSISVT